MKPQAILRLSGALFATTAAFASTPALAQDVLDELPEVELQRIPPVYSYDVGMQAGVADITYWRDEVGAGPAFGAFFSWGWHPRGNDRFGPGMAVILEGPLPLYYSVSLEPTFRWDRIMGKLAVGGAVGGAVMFHGKDTQTGSETGFTPAPVVAARIGYSEGWTRIGSRLMIVAEPKVRLIAGQVNYGVSLQVGTGKGY